MHLVGFYYKNTPPLWGSSITLSRTTFVRTPLDEWSACRRDLYLTRHNTQKRETSVPAAKFKLAFPASESPQTHSSDRAATKISCTFVMDGKLNVIFLTVRISGYKVSPATFTLEQGWQAFLRERARIVYKFRRNPFACPWWFWRAIWGVGVFHKLLLITALLLLINII